MRRMFFALIGVALLAVGKLQAGAEDTLLTFGTTGPDCYSDGSTVLDGECYALVWTKEGSSFGGFNSDGSLVLSTDKAVVYAPVARDGRCPTTLFQISSEFAKEHTGGSYSVYLLDTRLIRNGRTVPAGIGAGGAPSFINGFSPVIGSVKASSSGFLSIRSSIASSSSVNSSAQRPGLSAQTSGSSSVCTSNSTAIRNGLEQPEITGIRVDGNSVYLTIQNLPGYIGVRDGKTVKSFGPENPAVEADGKSGPVTIVMPLESGSAFFKAYRK